MRKLFAAIAFVLTLPVVSQAAPCLPGTLAAYLALGAGGCEVGLATVSDFTSASFLAGATEIAPSDVTVTPVAGATALDFGLAEVAGPGDLFDILIRYSVSGGPFRTNILSMTGSAATGDGVVTAVEDKCVGGEFLGIDPTTPCAGTPLTLIDIQIDGFVIPTDLATFAASSFFDVFTGITIDGGLSGTAQLGTVRNTFSKVPEPAMLLAMVSGLGACLARRKKRPASARGATAGKHDGSGV
jgi:hypothetical protein